MDFRRSNKAEPHRERTREILKQHPAIRRHIGKNPASFACILGMVLAQVALAWVLRDQPWWLIVLAAYFVGAFIDHALFVMIHECTHNLVFRTRGANTLAGILADMPMPLPGAAAFRKYHLLHHAFQGVYALDADIPSRWEARFVGNSWWRKAIWLLLFPLFQSFRPHRLKEVRLWDRWVFTNLLVQVLFDAAVIWSFGPKAFVYLLAAFFFSIGLHPLGARWIQRHYLLWDNDQETSSYYGPLNALAFNVGYHNEHHDFPSVPWNRLPKIRREAQGWYDTLRFHRSWTKVLFRFIFDPNVSLYSRMIREDRGGRNLVQGEAPELEEGKEMEPAGIG